jgi:hypothetical protein
MDSNKNILPFSVIFISLILIMSCVVDCLKTVKANKSKVTKTPLFFAGRIPPGQFEYTGLNSIKFTNL